MDNETIVDWKDVAENLAVQLADRNQTIRVLQRELTAAIEKLERIREQSAPTVRPPSGEYRRMDAPGMTTRVLGSMKGCGK